MTPHERSKAWLASEGYTAETVEHHQRHALRASDLFGCVDILALRGLQTLAVQVTDVTNVAARRKKVEASPFYEAMRDAGWRVVVHGWRSTPDRKGQLLREVVVLEGRPSWEQLALDLEVAT